jgi:hypothetical protein
MWCCLCALQTGGYCQCSQPTRLGVVNVLHQQVCGAVYVLYKQVGAVNVLDQHAWVLSMFSTHMPGCCLCSLPTSMWVLSMFSTNRWVLSMCSVNRWVLSMVSINTYVGTDECDISWNILLLNHVKTVK